MVSIFKDLVHPADLNTPLLLIRLIDADSIYPKIRIHRILANLVKSLIEVSANKESLSIAQNGASIGFGVGSPDVG
jgi:hypothetical protein